MFIFPMAGISKRFQDAGYALPKYMLEAHGKTIFEHVLLGFKKYFADEVFLFICRDVAETPAFIAQKCKALGIKYMQIIVLDAPTRGQAETVALGLGQARVADNQSITIFNIDTIHAGFSYPPQNVMSDNDGFLEVFRGEGDAWSFARTKSKNDMSVMETAEKRRISPWCSSGLYHFRHVKMFMDAYQIEASKSPDRWSAKELYIAPLYNHLIQRSDKIIAVEVDRAKLTPCGVPSEYEAFCRSDVR